MSGDPVTPRLEGEGEKAYASFLVYRNLGMGKRSLELTRRGNGEGAVRGLRLLEEWCSRWDWVARAKAWDEAMLALRHRAMIRAAAQEAARWAARRQQALEDAWGDSDLLRAKGLAMLATPIGEARWSMKTAIDAVRAAHELRDRIGKATAVDFEALSSEELEAIAETGEFSDVDPGEVATDPAEPGGVASDLVGPDDLPGV